MPIDDTFSALYLPADLDQPVRPVQIRNHADISGLLNGWAEQTRYDRDSVIFVHETGRLDGMAMNERATAYIKTLSDSAKQGRMVDAPQDYGLYGPAVVVGVTEAGDLTDVPQRVVDHLNGLQVTPAVVAEVDQAARLFQIGYTTVEDNLHHIERISQPQTHVNATAELNDHFILLINADDGFAFDAETAQMMLSALEDGEEFEATVEDRTYFLMDAGGEDQTIDIRNKNGPHLGYDLS